MEKISLNVGTIFCYDCVVALRKFIGSIKGIDAVEVDEGKVAVSFDPAVIDGERVALIVRESVEKLGYRILD